MYLQFSISVSTRFDFNLEGLREAIRKAVLCTDPSPVLLGYRFSLTRVSADVSGDALAVVHISPQQHAAFTGIVTSDDRVAVESAKAAIRIAINEFFRSAHLGRSEDSAEQPFPIQYH